MTVSAVNATDHAPLTAGTIRATVLLAAITVKEILELLLLLIIVNGLITLPIVVALVGAWGERMQNQRDR